MIGVDWIFYYGIRILFLTQVKNISAADIVLATSFYGLCYILFQIPNAIILSKIGKKKTIREIDLSHNKIKKINIRVLKKAYKIDVSYNKLKGRLMLPRLIYADANTIDCDNNKLKYIINPKNSCIWILCCNHNKLKTIDLNIKFC